MVTYRVVSTWAYSLFSIRRRLVERMSLYCRPMTRHSQQPLSLQTGEETFFKIKKSTKMSKVFETYAQRKGVQSSSLRFLLDGERIDGDNTPKMLELDDQDQIDCMLEQTGGN